MQSRIVTIVLTALLATLLVAPSAPAAAKKGKVNVCVEKRGKDKGAMRFAGKKKCHKGEKKVTLNKKGPPGPAGARGPEGPAGQGASADQLAALQEALAAQAAQISALQTQLAAACSQLVALTSQTEALGAALDGIGLGGTIPPLLTLITPAAPSPLPAFSC
jgi:hypothetical protein